MREFAALFAGLVAATALLSSAAGQATGDEAPSRAGKVTEHRQGTEARSCTSQGQGYLKCLGRNTPAWNLQHGPAHGVARQALCDFTFADYFDTCYNPDSPRCQKRRQYYDKCVMGRETAKTGPPNSAARVASCQRKYWRYVRGDGSCIAMESS